MAKSILTPTRVRVLRQLANDGGWISWRKFYADAPCRASNRTTRISRKRRQLPWVATFQPLIEAGLIETKFELYNHFAKITEAGRTAII